MAEARDSHTVRIQCLDTMYKLVLAMLFSVCLDRVGTGKVRLRKGGQSSRPETRTYAAALLRGNIRNAAEQFISTYTVGGKT